MAGEIGGIKYGAKLNEGKTKEILEIPSMPAHVIIRSKDIITAGDGAKRNEMTGKAVISNKTNAKIFEILNAAGVHTAFDRILTENSFLAKKCEMIPIEWVARRLATGSYLRTHPGVKEGFKFAPLKLQTYFKDDANHDPMWSDEQILSAEFTFNNRTIGQNEIDIMKEATATVFEILERAWNQKNCTLVDMKVEYGIDKDGQIMLADVIDSDSWRLWPEGDPRRMVDKQVYRNLKHAATEKDLEVVKANFKWVSEQLETMVPFNDTMVVIMMGSPSDNGHCTKIANCCKTFGLNVEVRVSSAHKGTEDTIKILRRYEADYQKLVIIAVAGRSNGLGPVLSGNSTHPVINCPPPNNKIEDTWSSLNMPSGLGCTTVLNAEGAALMAAQIFSHTNFTIWSKLRAFRLMTISNLKRSDETTRFTLQADN